MKKSIILLATIFGWSGMMADNITRDDVDVSTGGNVFSIGLVNDRTDYVSFQMDITLPYGISLDKSTCGLCDRFSDNSQGLTIGKQEGNTYRLTSTSFSLKPINKNFGDLLEIGVNVNSTSLGGTATISNIRFATSNSERVILDDVSFEIRSTAAMPISFADEVVKSICVANWDVNHDGELSYGEAAEVTELGVVFKENLEITSFAELQYFSGLTSIEESTFRNCENLQIVNIPSTITNIGEYAFSRCYALSSINIPDGVINIDNNAFEYCRSLSSFNIPIATTKIGGSAFQECTGLISFFIPRTVTSIGNEILGGCNGLTSIVVEDGNLMYDSRNDCNAIIETANNKLIAGCQNTIIPNDIAIIGNKAFKNCSNLTNVTIPNTVTSIGKEAFRGCSALTSIAIPDLVTYIGNHAFEDCSSLSSAIVIPDGVTIIESEIFKNCSNIPSITLSKNVTSIGGMAFDGCSGLSSFVIPDNVTTIEGHCFRYCTGLTSITIPEKVTKIGMWAFQYCLNLTSIFVDSNNQVYDSRDNCNAIIETANNKLFYGCKNTIIPNSVTSIGQSAFEGCTGLTSIIIPNGVTSIDVSAFEGCSNLQSISIPSSITKLGAPFSAFGGCVGLKSLKISLNEPLAVFYFAFSDCANATLCVPKGSRNAYAAADGWKDFARIAEFPSFDVNFDNEVDVVDVVDIARYVVGTPSDNFIVGVADLNSDDEVNVVDAVVLVNEIVGDMNFARSMQAEDGETNLYLTYSENNKNNLSLQMEGNASYTAFQFDLKLPNGINVDDVQMNMQRMSNHQLLFNKVKDGMYRVVALSTSNSMFEGTTGELVRINLDATVSDDIMIENIHLVSPEATDIHFDAISVSNEATSVDGITLKANKNQTNIFNLNGQRIEKPRKGLNIINGQKVILR